MEKEQIVDFMSGMLFYNPNSTVVLRGLTLETSIVPGKGTQIFQCYKVVIITVGLIFYWLVSLFLGYIPISKRKSLRRKNSGKIEENNEIIIK